MSPNVLKKPLLKLNRLVGHQSASNHMSKPRIGNTTALDDEREQRELKKAQAQLAKELVREDEKRAIQLRREQEEESARESDAPEISTRYGTKTGDSLVVRSAESPISGLANTGLGDQVNFTARIHHVRSISSKLAFVVFRQQLDTIQGVLQCREGVVSERFVRWAEHLTTEGLVRVQGRTQKPQELVHGCTVQNTEILIESLHVVVPVEERLPVDVYNIDVVEKDEKNGEVKYLYPNRVRMANRISYLRTPTMQSVLRINSAMSNIFRSTLVDQGFIEIHTPKLQPAATESGAEVFQVKYFDRTAFLAQSPQLAKQMCISADFGRVFEIGSVFRAEDSNTHRHLTEYVSMDLEMVIESDYHEAMDLIDNLLKSIFKGVYQQYRKEIDIVKTHFPHDDLVWLDKTPRLPFKEAIALLNSSGWTDDNGDAASEHEDLSTRAEIRLGELVKEKYATDYYILDKFPRSARPFYTQLDPDDDQYTNSFDIFLRGQEITTGGQRIHDPRVLARRMRDAGIDPGDMEEYMQAFEWGVLPHAGCGIGLERLVFLMLNLGDVRNATLFPRDPKSLPERKKGPPKLYHPEADTILYSLEYERWSQREGGQEGQEATRPQPPSVEDLIANYGDATNTSWLDDRYRVWRHEPTGAAVGYAEENGYALIMGNPLCDSRQYAVVISAFLKDLRRVHDLRPIWLLVAPEVEEILGSKLGWRTLSCVAEERVDVGDSTAAATKNENLRKKLRQAEDAGVVVRDLPRGTDPVPDDVRARCDRRIDDWKAGRSGTKQVHITEVRPWVDARHRRFLWAEDRDGRVVALVVLHYLSRERGAQIKFALDFPGSPSGAIELLISRAIQALAESGVREVTFGVGATRGVEFGDSLKGTLRARILARTYRTITEQLKLVAKSEFREKFGARDDPVYICYPSLGLGVSGARTLIKFFEDEM